VEPRTSGNAAVFPTRSVTSGPRSGEVPSASQAPRDETLSSESPVGTLASLPPPNTKRWVVRRKAAVVAAVRSGGITIEEACRVYQLSKEELLSWERAFEIHGLPGLRATRVQQYRRTRRQRVPLGIAKPAS
jgi:transposase-like protein